MTDCAVLYFVNILFPISLLIFDFDFLCLRDELRCLIQYNYNHGRGRKCENSSICGVEHVHIVEDIVTGSGNSSGYIEQQQQQQQQGEENGVNLSYPVVSCKKSSSGSLILIKS